MHGARASDAVKPLCLGMLRAAILMVRKGVYKHQRGDIAHKTSVPRANGSVIQVLIHCQVPKLTG